MYNDEDLQDSQNYSDRRDKNENPFKQGVLDLKSKKVGFYKIKEEKEGRNIIDIIPYVIQSDNNPILFDKRSNLKKGKISYLVRFSVHKNIGVNDETIVCPKETFGKPCPVCEERWKLYEQKQIDLVKKLNCSDRALYWVRDPKNNPDEVLIFDQSCFYFEKEMTSAARAIGDEQPVSFASIKNGKSVVFLGVETEIGKNKWIKPKSFTFIDRKLPVEEAHVEKTFDLSDYLVVRSYEEISALFFGIDSNSSENVHENPWKEESSANDIKCPAGLKFGKNNDFDKHEECNSCPAKTWEECSKYTG